MSSRATDYRIRHGLQHRVVHRQVHVKPPAQTGPLERKIDARIDGIDRRSCDHVVVSAGYPDSGGSRDISVRIGNCVAILAPAEANALAVVILDVNSQAAMYDARL